MADLQKFIDELRAKVSIADVVGEKVKLVRKGHKGFIIVSAVVRMATF